MNIYHRYFTQYMLKNGVVTVDNALTFCKHVSQGKIENMTQFKTMVIELNREISKQFYKIVFNTCEVTNQEIIVWLNTKSDDISRHQITYVPLELEYFHAILQEIIHSEEHRITFIVCINITSTLTSHLSRESGQTALNKWLRGGYYIRDGSYIYLGPRLILEFTSYLRSHCPNSICSLCSELVFTGKKCGLCNKVLHSYCLSKYLENQNKCPCCKSIWMQTADEDADTSLDEGHDNSDEGGSMDLDDDTINITGVHKIRDSQYDEDDDSQARLRKRQKK